jgi:choline dehydrogenase-like flavoprotein
VQPRADGGFDGANVGFHWVAMDVDPKNFTRSSARKAYFDPASQRTNLDLLVNSYVSTLIIKDKRAVGANIALQESGKKLSVLARKEVILAAGSIHTPQILQLTGIGPASLLEGLGIEVVMDLPGVGANFQDHPTLQVAYRCKAQKNSR